MAIDSQLLEMLKQAAKDVSKNAYCRYSEFPVGAAVCGGSGKIYTGCNVENVSFGLTMCAERSAIFSAIAAGEKTIQAVVIFTPTESLTPPCGACRQVISEFGDEVQIVSFSNLKSSEPQSIQELLPSAFGTLNHSE